MSAEYAIARLYDVAVKLIDQTTIQGIGWELHEMLEWECGNGSTPEQTLAVVSEFLIEIRCIVCEAENIIDAVDR